MPRRTSGRRRTTFGLKDKRCQNNSDESQERRTVEHGEEAPGDSDAAGEITLGGRERVGGRGGLEEEPIV